MPTLKMITPFSSARAGLAASILGLLVTVSLVMSCRKEQAAAPIPIDQVPAVVETVFQQAPSEARETASQAVTALRRQDEPGALLELHELNSRPDLTSEQRDATSRALATLYRRLSDAASKGDKQAEAALEQQRARK